MADEREPISQVVLYLSVNATVDVSDAKLTDAEAATEEAERRLHSDHDPYSTFRSDGQGRVVGVQYGDEVLAGWASHGPVEKDDDEWVTRGAMLAYYPLEVQHVLRTMISSGVQSPDDLGTLLACGDRAIEMEAARGLLRSEDASDGHRLAALERLETLALDLMDQEPRVRERLSNPVIARWMERMPDALRPRAFALLKGRRGGGR